MKIKGKTHLRVTEFKTGHHKEYKLSCRRLDNRAILLRQAFNSAVRMLNP